MRQIKHILSMLGALTQALGLSRKPSPFPPSSKLSGASSKFKPEAEDRSYSPGFYEIVVEEVDQVEFVQEWGRTIAHEALNHEALTHEALNHGTKDAGEVSHIDRRLPHYDRRRSDHDRREGHGHDRRIDPMEVHPHQWVDRRLPHFDRRRPGHDRRAGDGHDRRVFSMGANPATGIDRRLPDNDRRRPGHDRRAGNGRDRRSR